MLKKSLLTIAAAGLLATACGAPEDAQARNQIRIVGSSTVFPFTTAVAEEFGKTTRNLTPIVESTGTGGGMKLFCQGVGVQHPDVTNASRRIKPSEVELCAQNGVKEIIEVKVGYDGIAVANAKGAPDFGLTLRQLYLALAKEVPVAGTEGGKGNMVKNPYTRWSEIDPNLPAIKIEVLGPPPTSGTRDSFNELAIEAGCATFSAMKALKKEDKNLYKSLCRGIREDGAFIEAGENDNLIVQKLVANPNALGVFGFSFLEQNSDKLKGAKISGVVPTFATISSGDYPLSRSLFIYGKKAHVGVIPGMKDFLQMYVSEQAMGQFGYLADKGLVPLPPEELEQVQDKVEKLVPLDPSDLAS